MNSNVYEGNYDLEESYAVFWVARNRFARREARNFADEQEHAYEDCCVLVWRSLCPISVREGLRVHGISYLINEEPENHEIVGRLENHEESKENSDDNTPGLVENESNDDVLHFNVSYRSDERDVRSIYPTQLSSEPQIIDNRNLEIRMPHLFLPAIEQAYRERQLEEALELAHTSHCTYQEAIVEIRRRNLPASEDESRETDIFVNNEEKFLMSCGCYSQCNNPIQQICIHTPNLERLTYKQIHHLTEILKNRVDVEDIKDVTRDRNDLIKFVHSTDEEFRTLCLQQWDLDYLLCTLTDKQFEEQSVAQDNVRISLQTNRLSVNAKNCNSCHYDNLLDETNCEHCNGTDFNIERG